MKKIIILFIILFIGFISFTQDPGDLIIKTNFIASKVQIDSANWSDWSDWEKCNLLIIFSADKQEVFVDNLMKSKFYLHSISKLGNGIDENGNLFFYVMYRAYDKYNIKCIVNLIRLEDFDDVQIYFSYKNLVISYLGEVITLEILPKSFKKIRVRSSVGRVGDS